MNLYDFFVNRKKEDESVKEIVKSYLDNKAKIYSYRKKEELLKEIIKLFSDQSKSLMRLNSIKNKLLGIVSHELKNSINIIQNYAEYTLTLKKNKIDPEIESILKIIFNSAVNTGLLLDNMLDFSSIQEGRLKLFLDSVNVIDLVDNIIIANTAISEFKKIKIIFEKKIDNLFINTDRYKLYQILSNILSNAIKYSPEGERIIVSIDKKIDKVVISVKDNGPGIPAEKLDELFNIYSRIATKPTGKEKSTGLGLFITKYLTEAIGGKIEVESEVGKGTKFNLFLPLNES